MIHTSEKGGEFEHRPSFLIKGVGFIQRGPTLNFMECEPTFREYHSIFSLPGKFNHPAESLTQGLRHKQHPASVSENTTMGHEKNLLSIAELFFLHTILTWQRRFLSQFTFHPQPFPRLCFA
ncbi:MAG: hypothetical protein ACE5H0_03445 [Bacteroidota bacterium]